MAAEFNEANFDAEVINSKEPVLVDFWASWCVPCKLMAPVVEGLADEFRGRLKVGKTNVDENGELATKFSVLNIPTLILFKGGKEAARMIGINSKEAVARKINDIVGS